MDWDCKIYKYGLTGFTGLELLWKILLVVLSQNKKYSSIKLINNSLPKYIPSIVFQILTYYFIQIP